jgi:hypothetical protein
MLTTPLSDFSATAMKRLFGETDRQLMASAVKGVPVEAGMSSISRVSER